MKPHIVSVENAGKIAEWLRTRGGIAIWRSIDLGNSGKSWTCPVNDENGQLKGKPGWQSANMPERIITEPAEVVIETSREVKRFHVAVQRGGLMGMNLQVTSGGSRRIEKEVAKAGENAHYEFDYETQEAVILVPAELVPLPEWLAKQEGVPACT